MKNLIIITFLISSIALFSQTQRDDFLGIWEWQNNNQTFRVNFFNEPDGDGTFSLAGHFTMLETDVSGNETILYTSDRFIETTNERFIPMINGGRYCDWIDSFRFSLMDNTTTKTLLLGVLDLKFISISLGNPLQITWKLRVDGMASVGEVFNVPTDITLTKQ